MEFHASLLINKIHGIRKWYQITYKDYKRNYTSRDRLVHNLWQIQVRHTFPNTQSHFLLSFSRDKIGAR